MVSQKAQANALTLLLLMSAPVQSLCVVAEQSGAHDWHREGIGEPIAASFSQEDDQVIVATKQGALAAINTSDGKTEWRRIMEDGDEPCGVETAKGLILSASGGASTTVRAWTKAGGLLWETNSAAKGGCPRINSGGAEALKAVGGMAVSAPQIGFRGVSISDGSPFQRGNLECVLGASVCVTDAVEVGSGGEVAAVGVDMETGMPVGAQMSVSTGEAVSHGTAQGGTPISGGVACVTDSNGQNIVVGIADGGDALAVVTLSGLVAGKAQVARISQQPEIGNIAAVTRVPGSEMTLELKGEEKKAIVRAQVQKGNEVEMKTIKEPSQSSVVAGEIVTEEGEREVGIATSKEQSVDVEYIGAEEGKGKGRESIKGVSKEEEGSVKRVFMKSKEEGGVNAMMVLESGSVVFSRKGKVEWERQEGLASIKGVEFIDMPHHPTDNEQRQTHAQVSSAEMQMEKQWRLLKSKLGMATAEDLARLETIRRTSGDKLKEEYDTYGFRKILVVNCDTGLVAGLHSGNGRVMWKRQLTNGLPFVKSVKLAKQASSRKEIALFGPVRRGSTEAYIIDGQSGEMLERHEMEFEVGRVIEARTDLNARRRSFILVDKETKDGHAFPGNDTESTEMAQKGVGDGIYPFEISHKENKVTGYRLGKNRFGGEAEFKSTQVWEHRFNKSTTAIAATALPKEEGGQFSSVRILGDRSVLHKYVNPNTLFLATYMPANKDTKEEESIVAHVIDTVTGSFLYRVRHRGASQPVLSCIADNAIVYHYFNSLSFRYELSVLELYRAKASETSAREEGERSGVAPTTLRVAGQSYFTQNGVRAIGATLSLKGISSTLFLFATDEGRLVTHDRKVLDPRRPAKLSAKDKEEGLLAYTENLPLFSHSFLSLDRTISKLSHLFFSPSRLESSSSLLATGIDLFFTRATPNKEYDMLSDDFPKPLLVLTLVLLALGALSLGLLSSSHDAQKQWN